MKLLKSKKENEDAGEQHMTPEILPPLSREIRHIERDLSHMGFFSPDRKKAAKKVQSKTIKLRQSAEARDDLSVRIGWDAEYGQPTTPDLDKWVVLQLIAQAQAQSRPGREIQNPIKFTSYEMLKWLGHNTSGGRNVIAVVNWIRKLHSTTIIIRGNVSLPSGYKFGEEGEHIIESYKIRGEKMEDGSVAMSHHIFLSRWQIENLNAMKVIPIDFTTYRQMKNPMAKILLPMLQVWLYASRDAGVFKKSYADVCELLGITLHKKVGRAMQQFKRACEELEAYKYIRSWDIEAGEREIPTNLVLIHGAKFFADMKGLAAVPLRELEKHDDEADGTRTRIAEENNQNEENLRFLIEVGYERENARSLLAEIDGTNLGDKLDVLRERAKRNDVKDQLAYFAQSLRRGVSIPPGFETATKRAAREKTARVDAEEHNRQNQLKSEYAAFRENRIEELWSSMSPGAQQELRDSVEAEFNKTNKAANVFKGEAREQIIRSGIANHFAKNGLIATYDEWVESTSGTPEEKLQAQVTAN